MGEDVERAEWIELWAERIETLGLSPIALLLLEGVRAFRELGCHAFLMARPLLSGIADDELLEQVAVLLNQPELLDRLVAHLGKGG